MHVVFREARGLEETETPFDPGQTPADLVVLSFSDSDLGAFAAGWHRGRAGLPSVRLQNLIALKHPLSVDTYAEGVLAHAKGILIRLIGGEGYWAYGLAVAQDLARRQGIALAVLPADGRPDERLDALSTLPVSTLRRLSALCEAGGAVAAQAALAQLALSAGLYAGPVAGAKEVPDCGWYDPDRGVIPAPFPGSPPPPSPPHGGGGEAPDFDRITDAARAMGTVLSPKDTEWDAKGSTMAQGAARPIRYAADASASPPPRGEGMGVGGTGTNPARIAVTFYRSYLTAADTAPVDALIRALRARGFAAFGLFAPSLKGPAAAYVRDALAAFAPSAIANATAFSAKSDDGTSPLDAPGCPVFQVALSTARRRDWQASERGLSPADLAMHVVLPEVDGRLFAGVVSFKSPGKRDPDLQFSRFAHRADADRIEAVADRVAGWHRLSATPAADKRVALVLSTYPGRDWNMAHAVGLDALASAEVILAALAAGDRPASTAPAPLMPPPERETSATSHPPPSTPFLPAQGSRAGQTLGREGLAPPADAVTSTETLLATVRPNDVQAATPGTFIPTTPLQDAPATARPVLAPFFRPQVSRGERLGAGGWPPLCDALAATIAWPMEAYREALATVPDALRDRLHAAWGQPEDDPACDGAAFRFRATRQGNTLIALQPERGEVATRSDGYHDLSRTPRHAYVAFYLWLRAQGTHALVHIGAHGTLEWLPGKAVALSGDCWPEVLTGALPVIYPFIVNDPGEAAQAKRRIGALTLGHMPPPLVATALPANLYRLERLLDEYATADGLDPARRDRLIAAIRDEAQAAGVEADLAIPATASPAEAIPRIDRFVCDIKESQYGAGLHVFGDAPGEMEGLMAALSGRRVAPGPSGSPYRGRTDVQPTGRNMFSVDPRAVPSRAAHAQGIRLAEELLRRHLQDQGDWPRGLVVDLWGSATMRTAGEEFAMALHLAGLAPVWDAGSDRVTGVEVVPLALLRRPRIDVTLRVSGLFRDVFPSLAQVFETGAALLAEREEDSADNPYRTRAPRVFGPQPGHYGFGMGKALEDYSDEGRRAAGEAWLAASAWAIDAKGETHHDREGLESRIRAADAFAHVQDLTETDVLVASDYAAHEGGFAAAQASLGGQASLYHIDATRAGDPRARSLTEEIARTVRARAADPGWATAMMAHGFRGGAEIAATMEHLAAFAHLTRAVPAHLIDLYHDATLGRDDLVTFLARENPGALAALQARFAALREAGLWISRRNSLAAPEAAE